MQKSQFIALVLGTAVVITGGVALARDGQARGPSFEAIDTDSDGTITEAELEALGAARMARVDTDADGFLSKDELVEMGRERSERRANRMLDRLDADNDGKLSSEELASSRRGGAMFERAYADGDGRLTREEFDEARAKMRDHRRGHGNDN